MVIIAYFCLNTNYTINVAGRKRNTDWGGKA